MGAASIYEWRQLEISILLLQIFWPVLLWFPCTFTHWLPSSLQLIMKSFVSKFSFLFMTLVFPLSMIKCSVVLIFIFSGKKSSFRYTFLLQFLSAFSLLPVSFCSPLGLCLLPPSGYPLIETSASFPLNSLSLLLIFYFLFNSSQSKALAPSLTTSGQMFGFGTLLQGHYFGHTAGGYLKTHGDLKEKSLVSLDK